MKRYITRHRCNPHQYGADIEAYTQNEAEIISLFVNGPEYEVCEVVGQVSVPEAIGVILETEGLLCLN